MGKSFHFLPEQLLISSLLIGQELEGRRVFTASQGVFWEGKSCPELLPLKRLSLLTQLKRANELVGLGELSS